VRQKHRPTGRKHAEQQTEHKTTDEWRSRLRNQADALEITSWDSEGQSWRRPKTEMEQQKEKPKQQALDPNQTELKRE
jgi:hypothetical protein